MEAGDEMKAHNPAITDLITGKNEALRFTLRDLFAIQILNGLLAASHGPAQPAMDADYAYQFANEMLRARAEGK